MRFTFFTLIVATAQADQFEAFPNTDCSGSAVGTTPVNSNELSSQIGVCFTEGIPYKAVCNSGTLRFYYFGATDVGCAGALATQKCSIPLTNAAAVGPAGPTIDNCYFDLPSGQCVNLFNVQSDFGLTLQTSIKATYSCGGGGGDNPCFARDTTACLVHDATATAAAAYDSCFVEGAKDASLASRVPMPELKAGDLVLSSDAAHHPTLARVIVTQHAQATIEAAMLTLTHTDGQISLTPDHVLLIDGHFVAARDATPGAMLSGNATITSVASHAAGIVNPITSNSRILAAGANGLPVVSSTHPEWIASWMLSTNVYPLPYSIASTLSYLFPESVQAFYDANLEPFFVGAAPALKAYKGALPAIVETPLVLGAFLLFDVALALAFAARVAGSIEGVALLAVSAMAITKAKALKALKA